MELSYFSHVLTTREKLKEEPHEKAPDRPKWRGNPELFVYEKVAFSPLLWYNKGKKLKTQQGGKCNGCLLESGKC